MAQYVITDGTRWIMRDRKGKYVPTSCEALADVFTNKQATGIFQSNLSKALKSVFRVQKIDEPPKLIKQISQETVQENTEKVSTAENVQRWIDKIEGLNGLATEALHRKDELVQQLSKVDQELSDVNHYIEFCNLNAAQITKEKYDYYESQPNVSAAIESDMSDDIIYGYGYYGGSIYEDNGKYYMQYSIGDSCD